MILPDTQPIPTPPDPPQGSAGGASAVPPPATDDAVPCADDAVPGGDTCWYDGVTWHDAVDPAGVPEGPADHGAAGTGWDDDGAAATGWDDDDLGLYVSYDTPPVPDADAAAASARGPEEGLSVGMLLGGEGPLPSPRGEVPLPRTDQVLDSHWAQNSQVTRLLCATTHLHGEYAEDVIGTLLDPAFTAIAPSWGLDPLALASHAKAAQTRRRERDRSLRYCLAGMVLSPLLVIVLYGLQALSPFSVALSIVLVGIAGIVAAWMIVFAHYELIRVSALEVMDGRVNPRDTVPPLDAGTRQRLEDLADANVVVFGGYQPFVGCGITLDSWTICVDVVPAVATGPDGAPLTGPDGSPVHTPVLAFDALDLHRHLLRTIPPQTPGGLWAAPRLFVAGNAATAVPGLVPEPTAPDTWPASRLPEEVLDRYTREPSEAARTYVCLAHPVWRGEIVVSMLLRAELAGSKLFVEGRTHALLPPKATFREVKWVPKHPRRAWLAVARSSAAVLFPMLLGCYQRKIDLARGTRRFLRDRRRMRKALSEGYPINYGATSSVREDAADPAELKYYASADEVRSFRLLKRQALDAVEGFLTAHGVRTTEFRRQAEITLAETTVHLHDLAAAGDGFGPRNTVTVGTHGEH